jgi:4-amino-4-deoxy-L-arabinose transferase-like glycosyltransferase
LKRLLRFGVFPRFARLPTAVLLAALTFALCFLWIERLPLFEWDESRHAVNAWEMMWSKDFFNYTFAGEPDRWNAKPQFLVWLIVAGYEIFGARELAVRWPSAVASCVTAFVMYRWLRLWFSREAAVLGVVSALTMRGVVGYHVGRTGDMDALFLAFVVVALFFLQKAMNALQDPKKPEPTRFGRGAQALFAASGFALGFAFLAKGFAIGLVLPGFACLLFLRPQPCGSPLRQSRWSGVFSFLMAAAVCPLLWIAAQATQGFVHQETLFGARSQLGTMIVYDVLQRVRGGVDGAPGGFDGGYLFRQLDVLASPWGYLFFLGLALLLASPRFRGSLRGRFRPGEPLHVAVCMLLPSALLLMLMRHKLPWYMAPLLPFVALATVTFVVESWKLWPRWTRGAVIPLALFALGRQILTVSKVSDASTRAWFQFHAQKLRDAQSVKVLTPLRQDEYAYLSWARRGVKLEALSTENKDAPPLEDVKRRPLLMTCTPSITLQAEPLIGAACVVTRVLK